MVSAKQWFRQLGHKFKAFGRQAGHDLNTFGRQAKSSFKLMPQAFKDSAKVYSSLERHTKGIPIIHELFSVAKAGTQAIGDGLSGNFDKSVSGVKDAVQAGEAGVGAIDKLAPMFL